MVREVDDVVEREMLGVREHVERQGRYKVGVQLKRQSWIASKSIQNCPRCPHNR